MQEQLDRIESKLDFLIEMMLDEEEGSEQVVNTSITKETQTSWRRSNQSSTQRGYNYRWQKARKVFLDEYPLCVYCEREGRITVATVVDHIKPHRGNQDLFWNKNNWQSLCAHCHNSVKAKEEANSL